MHGLFAAIPGLLIALISAPSVQEPALDHSRLDFFRGGDDGLTMRLFEAVIGGEENWKSCEGACRRVTLQQVRPSGQTSFAYEVEISPASDSPAESGIILRGRCRENELSACAHIIHGQIASALAAD